MPTDNKQDGMDYKDYLEDLEERKERAQRARGRICVRCGAAVPFDAPHATLCPYCDNAMNRDD